MTAAERAWTLLEDGYRAMLPEAHATGPGGALISAAQSARRHADALLTASVVASHE